LRIGIGGARNVAAIDLTWIAALAVAAGLGVAAGQGQLSRFAIVAAIAILLVTLFVHSPEFTLLGLIVVRPVVDAFVYTSVGGLTLGEAWGIGLIVVAVAYLIVAGTARLPLAPVLMVLAFLSLTLVRPVVSEAVSSGLKLASWLLVAIAVAQIARSRRGQEMILGAMTACATVCVLTVAVVIAQGRFGAAYYGFAEGGGGYETPHALSRLAVLLLPFVLVQVMAGRRVVLSLLLSGALGLTIIYSFVRTAYLALLVIVAAYVLASLRVATVWVKVSFVAMVAAIGTAVGLLRAMILARLSDLPLINSLLGLEDTSGELGAGSGRVTLWRGLWDRSVDSASDVVVGQGAGASYRLAKAAVGSSIWAHNDFLEFFVTGGLVLAAAYLLVLVWILRIDLRLFHDTRQSALVHACSVLALGVFAGYVVLSLADGVAMFAGSVVMGVFVGLTQGMQETPGETAIDAPLAVPSQAGPRVRPPAVDPGASVGSSPR
jgi:hypothetical protein